MYILGISCFYHDSAACIVRDGILLAAAQEERFTRIKHDHGFPRHAIDFCLNYAGIAIDEVDLIGFYDKPIIKFERILYTYFSTFPKSFFSFTKAMPLWMKQKLWINHLIRKETGFQKDIIYAEHHQSHAASAFLVSPFKEAAILTIDGVGEWATATYGFGKDKDIEIIKEIRFPHSLGLLYSAFTYYLGFKVNSAEYKVMGLAPYGNPIYYDKVRRLIDIGDDGSFWLDMKYFAYDYGLRMTNDHFSRLFGGPPRKPESPLDQRHKDIAASLQAVTEEVMIKIANHLYRQTRMKNLCLAGGVALNCVANGRILRDCPYEDIFIQPAAGDAGGAIGVAYFIYNSLLKNERNFVMDHAFWGPDFTPEEIKNYLERRNVKYRYLSREELLKAVAKLIDQQNVVGWFQGRMEFGPRALGNRSILADARNPKNKDIVNLKIKFRESFRPFAPTVLEEKVSDYFELSKPSPFMLLVARVRQDRRVIPSVTHVDGSARIQTINREHNELYYDLIKEFERQTSCPVIINTSFNVRGEPIICTPHDAFLCFMRTNMDYLVMDRFLMDKKEMTPLQDDKDWLKKFELD